MVGAWGTRDKNRIKSVSQNHVRLLNQSRWKQPNLGPLTDIKEEIQVKGCFENMVPYSEYKYMFAMFKLK